MEKDVEINEKMIVEEKIYQQIKNKMWKTVNIKEKIIIIISKKLIFKIYNYTRTLIVNNII